MSKAFVHIGAPKTGTSLIQDLLWLNRKNLADKGILYPGRRRDAHFMAALDLLEREWGGLEKDAVGSWDHLVSKATKWDGDVVISHEVFAGATEEQAARAVRELSQNHEVHIVYTARDLSRQVPAEWQEQVKHRQRHSYAHFLRDLEREEPRTYSTRWFWKVQDWPDVLRRWSTAVPDDRVHLVTVPPPGAPRDLLVDRLLDLWHIEREWLPESSTRSNVSLGAVETTVLRRLNRRNPVTKYAGPYYREFVREVLAHQTLAGNKKARRVQLPPDRRPWAEDLTRTWFERLAERGYDIIGDLDELRIPEQSGTWVDPDTVSKSAQLRVAEQVIDALLIEVAQERERGYLAVRDIETRVREREEREAADQHSGAPRPNPRKLRRILSRIKRKLRL